MEHDTVQPMPLNVRLRAVQPHSGGEEPLDADDACHPAVWSCGLHPLGWPATSVVLRPSRYAFSLLRLVTQHADPYDVRRLHSANLEVIHTQASSGQLNIEKPLPVAAV